MFKHNYCVNNLAFRFDIMCLNSKHMTLNMNTSP